MAVNGDLLRQKEASASWSLTSDVKMAKCSHFLARAHLQLLHVHHPNPMYSLCPRSILRSPFKLPFARLFSLTATPYPYQYDMIISRPANPPPNPTRRRIPNSPKSIPKDSEPDQDLGFDEWVDKKLSHENGDGKGEVSMDKAKRKYYNKRRKRMYGESDSDEENGHRGNQSDYIELKQEVVELRTLHKREEELYFYDAFAYPWEKNKHYKMVYQLEKKYFPDQCFDKAFLQPGESNPKKEKKKVSKSQVEVANEDDKGLVFFEDNDKESKDVKVEDITEKKVEDFFKCLKKFPNENDRDIAIPEPFFSTRSDGLPPKWDGPNGTVVLVNKPKGEFCVCDIL